MSISNIRTDDELCKECATGNVQRVSQLLSQMSPSDLRSAMLRPDSALYLAVSNNRIDACKLLVQQKCEDNRKVVLEGLNKVHPFDYKTPLYAACESGFDVMVELLLRSGAKLYVDEYKGLSYARNCFVIAYRNNHTNVCKVILDYKQNTVNIVNYHHIANVQLLHIACSRGDVDMIKLFARHAGEPAVIENPGTSAFGMACRDKDFAMMELLVSAKWPHSLLLIAVASGDIDCVAFVLQQPHKHQHCINASSYFRYWTDKPVNCTALELSSMIGSLPITQLLEAHGAVPSLMPHCLELVYACEHGHVVIAEHWVQKGALLLKESSDISLATLQIYFEIGCDLTNIAQSLSTF